ncbi:MAG: signal peptidase II [Bacteroidetes bacterium]|nr:signal peptidase II [Bacteroidota bacterium]MCZ2131921.1 signal peptidase II [Bacteroidota bacterium]
MNKRSSSLPYFIFTALLILFDQVAKLTVKGFSLFGLEHTGMFPGQTIPVIGDVIRFTFVENPGMAFGITFGSGKIFLTSFSLIAACGLAWYLHKLSGFSAAVRIGIMLILSGALGNFIDRAFYGVLYGESPLFFGAVVDFIQIDIPDVVVFGQTWSHWPVFNIADSCVTCGMILLFVFNARIPSYAQLTGKTDTAAESDTETTENRSADINSSRTAA